MIDISSWAAAGVVLSVLGVLAAFWRWALPFLRRVGHFLDDWFGEEARPGFPARPGVPARLAAIETEQRRVSHEVQTNSGSSLKDAIKRVEATQLKHGAQMQTQGAQIEALMQAFGAFIGREQSARIEGHKAQQELFHTMQQLGDTDHQEEHP